MAVFASGAPTEIDRDALRARMREPAIDLRVELADGDVSATAWGCDLSYDYVKINADYASQIVQKEDGGMAREDHVANYSPAFKRALLAEALKYIAAFSGQVAVIKYGGAAMVKESLKEAFAEDVALLKRVGLKPVVVHGGAQEVTRTMERLGERSEFVDGLRITDAASLPVVEMVLTGKVNQELVTLLNARDVSAVGLSGKDGQLLRARKIVHESGRDLGHVGEVVEVNKDFLRMLLKSSYVPVISPIGSGEDGGGLSVNADDVAAAVAVALGAKKLIYLTDVPGILESAPDGGDGAPDLRRRSGEAPRGRGHHRRHEAQGPRHPPGAGRGRGTGPRPRRPRPPHRHRRALHRSRRWHAGLPVSALDTRRRREAVARILRVDRVATQEELLGSLRREGFQATQGTLSRDLARLGARRVSRPEGSYYEAGDGAPAAVAAAVAGLVSAVATNGSLVVIRTLPGSAPAVARAIDLARRTDVLGTIAGDDTVFVAPARGRGSRALASRLAGLFEAGRSGNAG